MTNKTETWRKACRKLQSAGMILEIFWKVKGKWVIPHGSDKWLDTIHKDQLRIKQQPIPDRPDWREWCRKLQDCGMRFEFNWDGWETKHWMFKDNSIDQYRIPAQPIPAGIEKYLEEEMAEQKQDKPEIHHLEQQIQWHEDKLRSLRTGEPMREWEYKEECSEGVWLSLNEYGCYPEWHKENEYRRKPRTVNYWHCVGACTDKGGKEDTVYLMSGDSEDLEKEVIRHRKMYTTAKFSTITKTAVEIPED